jgi:hypothetical protein
MYACMHKGWARYPALAPRPSTMFVQLVNVKIRNGRLEKRIFEHVLFKIHISSLDI